MPGRSFQIANVASAIVWIPLLFAPAYLAGANLSPDMLDGWRGIGIGTALLIVPILIATLAVRLFLRRRRGTARAKTSN